MDILIARFNSLCDSGRAGAPLEVQAMAGLVEEVRAGHVMDAPGWLGYILHPAKDVDRLFLQMMQETMWAREGYPEPETWPLLLAVSVLRAEGHRAKDVFGLKYANVSAMWRRCDAPEDAWIPAAAAYNALRVAINLIPYTDPQLRQLMEHCRTQTQDVEPPWSAWGLGEEIVGKGVFDTVPTRWNVATIRQLRSDGWSVLRPQDPNHWTAVQLMRPGKYLCVPIGTEMFSLLHVTQGPFLHSDTVECFTSNGVTRSLSPVAWARGTPLQLARTVVICVEASAILVLQDGLQARLARTETAVLGLYRCGVDITYSPPDAV